MASAMDLSCEYVQFATKWIILALSFWRQDLLNVSRRLRVCGYAGNQGYCGSGDDSLVRRLGWCGCG